MGDSSVGVYVARFFQKVDIRSQVVFITGLWLVVYWLIGLCRRCAWWRWWFVMVVMRLWLWFSSWGGSVGLLVLCVCWLVWVFGLVCGVVPWVYYTYLLVSPCVKLTSLDLCVCAIVAGFAFFYYVSE